MTLRPGIKALPAIGVMLGGLCGCATPSKQDASAIVRSEVVKIFPLWKPNPFLSFDPEGDPNVEGFKFTIVLASRKTGKGIAEDGVVRTKLYRIDSTSSKKRVRSLVREWSVSTAGLPTFKSGALGLGYKLQFQWAKEEQDGILGHEVDVVVSFEGCDGRMVLSQPKRLRVPPARD